MRDNIDISWIDNDCPYPNVTFSSAVYDDDGTLSKVVKCKECLSSLPNHRNNNDNNGDLFSGIMNDIIKYIIDNISNVEPDMDFQRYYDLIMSSDNEKKILKSCYGVLMILRNWETHHSHSSTNYNNDYSYEHTIGCKKEQFFIHIPPKGIMLLKEILAAIIKRGCGITTQGHYLDFLFFHYDMLYTYLKIYGKYTSPKTELIGLKEKTKLKWAQRCLVLNPAIEFVNEHIRIKNSFSKNDDALDFLVVVEGEKYIIPQEILRKRNNGMRISSINKWKAMADYSHGIRLPQVV